MDPPRLVVLSHNGQLHTGLLLQLAGQVEVLHTSWWHSRDHHNTDLWQAHWQQEAEGIAWAVVLHTGQQRMDQQQAFAVVEQHMDLLEP